MRSDASVFLQGFKALSVCISRRAGLKHRVLLQTPDPANLLLGVGPASSARKCVCVGSPQPWDPQWCFWTRVSKVPGEGWWELRSVRALAGLSGVGGFSPLWGGWCAVRLCCPCSPEPFREAEFDIVYGEGISRYGELVDIGVKLDIIDKAGAWFTCCGTRLQGTKADRGIGGVRHVAPPTWLVSNFFVRTASCW